MPAAFAPRARPVRGVATANHYAGAAVESVAAPGQSAASGCTTHDTARTKSVPARILWRRSRHGCSRFHTSVSGVLIDIGRAAIILKFQSPAP